MGDIRLVSYMREGIAGPKSTCFGEVRDKMGISPMFLASATRPRNIQDNGSMVWAPLPTGVYGVLPGPASPSPPPLNCPVVGASQEPCSFSGKDRCLTGV